MRLRRLAYGAMIAASLYVASPSTNANDIGIDPDIDFKTEILVFGEADKVYNSRDILASWDHGVEFGESRGYGKGSAGKWALAAVTGLAGVAAGVGVTRRFSGGRNNRGTA